MDAERFARAAILFIRLLAATVAITFWILCLHEAIYGNLFEAGLYAVISIASRIKR